MKYFLTISLLFLAMVSFAQPKLNFTRESHDFGEIPEGKVATHEYEFVNTGDLPLIISNVQASCGCTTPFWTKEPVMPGKKGIVKASYNSVGRPGSFSKSVTVTSNAAEGTKALNFKGVVLAKGSTPTITDEMRAASANIAYDKTEVNLGTLETGQTAVARFKISNKGKTSLELYDVTSSNNSTSWSFSKPNLAPSETGTLEVTYRAPNTTGAVSENITVTSTDYNNYSTKLLINATVVASKAQPSVLKPGAGNVPFK